MLTTAQLKAAVDGVFGQIEASLSGHPIIVFTLQHVDKAVDAEIDTVLASFAGQDLAVLTVDGLLDALSAALTAAGEPVLAAALQMVKQFVPSVLGTQTVAVACQR